MKKISFLLLIISAVSVFSATAQDKDKPKMEGSGNVITKEISIQPFDQLDVSGVFSLKLSQGNKEEVKIEADDNLQDLFEVKNEGSKLVISMKKGVNFNSKKKMKVYITFKKLKSMDLKTVGDVSSEQSLSFDDLTIGNKSVGSIDLQLTAQSINIDNKSVGNIKLNGKADNARITNKSVGSILAADFVVQKMDIDNDGVGSAEVNAEKELKVKDSFLGKVRNKGAATIKKSNRQVI
ncbi:MAG: head GIN domain-containing protein [Bacteroidota bacterium]|nr:head GIN domain-containing protein [Bacteroidota bacterium]